MRFSILFFLTFMGCGESAESAESIDADWKVFVADNNTCQSADQCVVVFPGCPLGCGTAVSKSAENEAIIEAGELIRSYQRDGRACNYGCVETPAVVCESNACDFQK